MIFSWYFQEVIEAQEKTITNLLKAVKEQHDQLDNQKIQIKNLEEKVDNSSTRFPYHMFLWGKYLLPVGIQFGTGSKLQDATSAFYGIRM